MLTREAFAGDKRGRTFTDVLENKEVPFDSALRFFRHSDRLRRMMESEMHHARPALAGVILDFEDVPEVRAYFEAHGPRDTVRFRQSVGILVRMLMIQAGWEKTGIKGSLGTRSPTGSTAGGANKGGLSKWFSRSERYRPVEGNSDRPVWDRRNMKG